MSGLRLSGVTAGYHGRVVAEAIDLEVKPGELWVLLGPNGAGKSTVAKVAAGLLTPMAGEVTVEGLRVGEASAQALAKVVGWVPQAPPADLDFTALELTLMGRAPHLGAFGLTGPKDEALALQSLEAVDAKQLSHRRMGQLSGGEARRIWLARALTQQPKVLVLDEPSTFLDVRHQLETMRVVQRLAQAGLAVLMVLHDINLARSVATHAALLREGRVLARGPIEEVLTESALTQVYGVTLKQVEAWLPSLQ